MEFKSLLKRQNEGFKTRGSKSNMSKICSLGQLVFSKFTYVYIEVFHRK